MEHKLSLNGVDLSGYVTNTELRDVQAADQGPMYSVTVSGTWEADMPSLASLFTAQEREFKLWQPDGRWQALKARLARRWPLRWLKVRWRVYTTRGVPSVDLGTGAITVKATAVAVTTITCRGKP